MEFINYTPLPHLVFPTFGRRDVEHNVIVLRGSFRIDVDKRTLFPAEKQEDIVLVETPFTEDVLESLRYETDLSPFKPSTDIHINATTYAPNGQPKRSWLCSAEFADHKLVIEACGPNSWQRVGRKWYQQAVEPCSQVPLRYDHAFGGEYQSGKTSVAYTKNPVGRGWIDKDYLPDTNIIQGSQLVMAGQKIESPFAELDVAGLLPIHRSWQPRLKLAGTFDEEWAEIAWPYWPDDYQNAFHNSANPALISDKYAEGGEPVVLKNLHKELPVIEFSLPNYTVMGLVRYESGAMEVRPAYLDTVYIDVESENQEEHRVFLTWRATFAATEIEPVRQLEARIEQGS